ncbi:HAD-IC family P-type ATPase [Corynebacterium hindlerae]|uniref:HAD-IC family P-type ATPase n=1 Tax=Corynebacterium hindlerae TaxID=699041 RepID=UPI001AD6BA81|nr:HAD-IC family P-type ATPase [Corynebacterium hindlerae]QTH60499.1 HAD-IC family P-type ATPase [Corynebacterium hindlerae]
MSFVTSENGLTSAEVAQRREQGAVNHVVRKTGRTVSEIVRSNVFTRINAILAILFAIVMVTGSWINGAFGLLIIANSSIGIIQELRAKRTLDRLTILGESKPRVLRDGTTTEISQSDIVLDDLIEVGSGEQILVDGVVKQANELKVDESMLSGESDPVRKKAGDEVLSGSFVVAGDGTFQATRIGEDSYAAKLVAEAGEFRLTDSELQKGIDKILKIIGWLLIPTGALTIWTQLWRTGAPVKEAVLAMVAALVPMVPEGLVLMTSIAFAVGVVRLGRRKALVNELTAIESLARVDTVCVDKTGTLTENRMELLKIQPLGETDVQPVLRAMVAADKHPNDTMQAIAAGLDDGETPQLVRVEPFDSARKWSGVDLGERGKWVLGAPEVLCDEDAVLHAVAGQLDQGLRVLLVAQVAEFGDRPTPQAMVILQQKLRPDARETLEYFAHEDVTVKVISGDNAVSVSAVARQVGIEGEAMDARDLTSDTMGEQVAKARIFGRVKPDQKRAMVVAMQAEGHTVAMTGDGVNDVLALKAADIGVAMGAGAPASRSVAQVVLLDNTFATLPHVVAEGRRVIGNIERVANLFLTKTIYSVVVAFVLGVAGLTYPFQPIHVTMIGWFTIGIPAFVLSLAPNTERARPGFVRRVLWLAIPFGVLIALFTMGFWFAHYPAEFGGVEHRQVATATLAVLLIMAMWVLGVVARPWRWWKVLLIGAGAVGYVLIFSVPVLQRWLLLDSANVPLLIDAILTGLVGAAAIEGTRWLSRWVDNRRR